MSENRIDNSTEELPAAETPVSVEADIEVAASPAETTLRADTLESAATDAASFEAAPVPAVAPEAGYDAEAAVTPHEAVPEIAPAREVAAIMEAAAPHDALMLELEGQTVNKEPDLWRAYLDLALTSPERAQQLKDRGEVLMTWLTSLAGTALDRVVVYERFATWLRTIPGIIEPYVLKTAKNMTVRALAVLEKSGTDEVAL